MQQSTILILVIVSASITCKPAKSGVFDNITVLVKGLDKIAIEDSILIEFDDTLNSHIKNKSSEIIIIQNQFIPKLEPGSISNLTVHNLTLTNNGIRQIQPGAFQNLPKLQVLDLGHNLLEEIRAGVFNHLVLSYLLLDHNKIARIDYRAFGNLRLKVLNLSFNQITRWSKDWLADSSVSLLNLGHNLIEELPPNAFRLMSQPVNASVSVIFSFNQLRKINDNVFNGFERFRRVYLDSNLIDRLSPGAFNGVKYINTLDLNNNSLSEIGADLLTTTQVDVLRLEDNKLRCLSTRLFRMEELDIDGNPITCFCVNQWLEWRSHYSNPSIYHIVNLEQDCI